MSGADKVYTETETVLSTQTTPIEGTGQDATINGDSTTSPLLVGGEGDDVIDGTVVGDDMLVTTQTQIDTWADWDTGKNNQTHHHVLDSTRIETTQETVDGVEQAVDQTFVESGGVNSLTGGMGADTFIFNINLHEHRTDYVESFDDLVATPTQLAGANTNGVWNSYLSSLAEWRAGMDALYGMDDDATTESQTYAYSTGKTVKTRTATFDDTYAWHTTEWVTNVSANTITDFGDGLDTIQLAGISQQMFQDHGGAITALDGGVRISIGSFSIDVLGAITEATAMDYISFNPAVV